MTAADVARSLGLSRATVGFVLNSTPGQSISEATKRRVLDEAQQLGYRPHTAARALASGRSRIVLLVLPDWPLGHSMRANIDEASLTLDRAGYSLVTTSPHPDGQAVPLWESLNPDVVLSLTPLPDDHYAAIASSGAIALVPDRGSLEFEQNQLFADGSRVQVEHLLAQGRRRIVFAGPDDQRLAGLAEQRRQVAAATLRDRADADLVAVATVNAGNARDSVRGWVVAGADSVVAYNDDVAAIVVAAALRQGIAIPDQLAIVGHDDTPLASLLVPAVSSVRVDAAGLGRYLALVAVAAVEGGTPPSAGPSAEVQLVRRETT
ncbi:LacI family transcriptional regulator [Microbacterium sp. Root166]|uniref:LacI family DNA-binding transcriptional regulator n=1 Tax=Microbacterium sp. Root166 TaxID=1736478 RepID=UPI0006F8DA66|nr:LacI family DNA-binding transcriptional regulator [Microbacterium sp. Root166]KQZ85287.1 LacI family transcriptional regulator [Microbacterium sp. Root166]